MNRLRFRTWTIVWLAAVLGACAPQPLRGPEAIAEWPELAARTWAGLERSLAASGLPADHLQWADGRAVPADYTTPTNVGLWLMAVPAARDLGLIDEARERALLEKTLAALERFPRSHGFWYNFFKTHNGEPDAKRFVSAVDNAWLLAGLMVASRAGLDPVSARAGQLASEMDLARFYDPAAGQFRLGYEGAEEKPSAYHYGQLCTETRIISYIALARGQVPPSHWARLYRTLPPDWTWQSQIPAGQVRKFSFGEVFSGHYVVDKTPIVPSWGGSLFEFLMPLLIVPETEWAPRGLGENNRRAVRLHRDYALKTRGYPVWGLSPCASPEPGPYRYLETGYAALGSKGYPDPGVIAPYASILALELEPAEVAENVRRLKQQYPVYGPYGFFDSVQVSDQTAAQVHLTLDQGMIFLAVHNFLTRGGTRRRFCSPEVSRAIEPLLRDEIFYGQ